MDGSSEEVTPGLGSEPPVVHVVDDDPQMRESLTLLLQSAGIQVVAYNSAEEFLDRYRDAPDRPGCLILDVRLPGMSGLGLQQRLAALEVTIPIIVLTAHADIPMTVHAIKAGAVDLLEKPVHRQTLLERIHKALDQDANSRYERKQRSLVQAGLETLSKREREVYDLLVEGKSTKQIAATLGIGLQTVAKHRAAMLEKMRVRNVAELVRLVMAAK